MAQLSTDTLAYAQIIAKVQKFIEDYSNLKNVSPKDYDKAYQQLLQEINRDIGGVMSKPLELRRGDVPSSQVFNEFILNLSNDLNIITNQFDTLSANYVNTFNLFSNKIESEKSFLTRVRSKINILEIYSNSTSVDITYFGDSFNDLSMVESSKITPGYIPDVSDGYASLARTNSSRWNAKVRIVNQNYNDSISSEIKFVKASNGLRGNHFIFENDGKNNPFLYEKDSSILRSNENSMLDKSAATYFEYEAIRLEVVNPLTTSGSEQGRPEYEFQCIGSGGKYVNWAAFDTSKPLSLTIEFTSSSKSGEYVNTISILPFFGYDTQGANALIKNIKVTSVLLFDEINNKTYELIKNEPIVIGSDIASKTIQNYKNFFYNKGIMNFDEVKVNKIYITLEQSEFNNTTIKHAYWTPYEVGSSQKWKNQTRFNPLSLISTHKNESIWDKNLVIPPIDNLSVHKSSANNQKQMVITEKESSPGVAKYQIKLTSAGQSFYWLKKDTNLNIDLFSIRDKANWYAEKGSMDATITRIVNGIPPTACVLVDPTIDIEKQLLNLRIKMKTVQGDPNSSTLIITTVNNHGLSANSKVYIRDKWGNDLDILGTFTVTSVDSPTQFRVAIYQTLQFPAPPPIPLTDIEKNFGLCLKVIDIPLSSNMSIETNTNPIVKDKKVFLNLVRNFEYLKAKRASIGIRDISIGKESYRDNAEIISKPFFINGRLELLSLEVSEYIPQTKLGEASIKYYVSVDGGNKWIKISPIGRSFEGIPEILAFNQNLSDNLTIPQIAYYNQPDVPNSINSIIFKAVIQKNKLSNSTPILYWYKLGARII